MAFYRKLRKLIRNPRAYFIDSKGWQSAARVVPFIPRSTARRRKGPTSAAASEALVRSGVLVSGAGADLAAHIDASGRQKTLAYIPWIPSHSDALMKLLSAQKSDLQIVPLQFLRNMQDAKSRSMVTGFARRHPDLYRRIILRELLPLRGKISAMLFTFDWHPAMRVPAQVCRELGILTVLVPHEGVFMERDEYYHDAESAVGMPTADWALCWGRMQQEIFQERGYPTERMTVTGAPKFDVTRGYQPTTDRTTFFKVWGLDERRKTILYAAQPLDNQGDTRAARAAQVQVVAHLLSYARDNECNVIVRTPPANTPLFTPRILARIENSPHAALDSAAAYVFPPLEMMYHTDVTVAINSTMLFEASLMGRPAISARYFDFSSFWEPLGLPAAVDRETLADCLDTTLGQQGSSLSKDGWSWAEQQLSAGAFDGNSAKRVVTALSQVVREADPLAPCNERFVANDPTLVWTVGFPHLNAHTTTHLHVAAMLGAQVRAMKNVRAAYACDAMAHWGAVPTPRKQRALAFARRLGRPIIYVEDGFVRSIDIGLSGEAGLSLMVDDLGPYYDATNASRLELTLQSDASVPPEGISRARAAIDKLVSQRVSKYNHAPDGPLQLGTPGRRKVAVLDQRRGDASVSYGLADDDRFEVMLRQACADHPDKDILVKRHPDALRGGQSSYYDETERLSAMPNVVLVDEESNPYRFLELVEEVYTVTSGMGFEALMAGKRVHCFGMPFYAGWGLTEDFVACERRTRRRSLEEVFYFAYFKHSRYYRPDWERVCELEDLVDYIVEAKQRLATEATEGAVD